LNLDFGVFQDRIAFQDLLDFVLQLQTGELQQLDGLLQLLGHDQRLSQLEILAKL